MSKAKKIIQLDAQMDGKTKIKKTKKKVDKAQSLNTQKLINKLDRLIRKVAKRGWAEGMDTRELNRRLVLPPKRNIRASLKKPLRSRESCRPQARQRRKSPWPSLNSGHVYHVRAVTPPLIAALVQR